MVRELNRRGVADIRDRGGYVAGEATTAREEDIVTVQRPWALWISGFFAAIAAVHAVPLVVREDVVLAGVQLTTTAALGTTVVSFVLSMVARKFAGMQAS